MLVVTRCHSVSSVPTSHKNLHYRKRTERRGERKDEEKGIYRLTGR